MRVLIAWLCLLFGFSLAVNEPCRGPSTVIAGGGVIGLSTAWYLAVLQHQTNVSSCIYIVDSSSELLAGASGHATGVLHFDDFKEETRSLSRLSWSEHQALAAEHNGRARYGFSSLTAYNITIFEEGSQTSINDGADVQLPRWFKNSDRYAVEAERFNTAAAILLVFSM
jgi:glycine/D-amino acid oxidase-like deaminating enzyme